MTYRQSFLKLVYPALMWWSRLLGKKTKNSKPVQPAAVSFYSLSANLINGQPFDFSQLKGKKVLLVNTASDCGYTAQYADLQKLWEDHRDRLVVLGFPSNNFKEQEKGSDDEIARFCQVNYGVSFPLMKKSVVVPGPDQNSVYQWLTDPARNGWNKIAPSWNFSKYLVDENGQLLGCYGPAISPLDTAILNAIQ